MLNDCAEFGRVQLGPLNSGGLDVYGCVIYMVQGADWIHLAHKR
jgi:hypothetical protein